MLKKLLHDQEGNVAVLFAFLAVLFIGIAALVIDVGIMYSERAKLVTAVDAAALAGVWKLPDESAAIIKASDYLDKNVDNISKLKSRQIKILGGTDNSKIVSVSAAKQVDLFFARAIGYSDTDISASAKASRASVKGLSGIIPVGITADNWNNLKDNYNNYKNPDGTITLKVITAKKNNSGNNEKNEESDGFDPDKGNFYALDLNYGTGDSGHGADIYRKYLGEGYPHMLYIGNERATETGTMKGPTDQGLTTRLAGNTCRMDMETNTIIHTCGREDKDCPRLGYIPVFQTVNGDLTGKTTIKIIGFLPFYISDSNNKGEVSGVFLDDIITDGVPGNESTPDYGIYAPKLIE